MEPEQHSPAGKETAAVGKWGWGGHAGGAPPPKSTCTEGRVALLPPRGSGGGAGVWMVRWHRGMSAQDRRFSLFFLGGAEGWWGGMELSRRWAWHIPVTSGLHPWGQLEFVVWGGFFWWGDTHLELHPLKGSRFRTTCRTGMGLSHSPVEEDLGRGRGGTSQG